MKRFLVLPFIQYTNGLDYDCQQISGNYHNQMKRDEETLLQVGLGQKLEEMLQETFHLWYVICPKEDRIQKPDLNWYYKCVFDAKVIANFNDERTATENGFAAAGLPDLEATLEEWFDIYLENYRSVPLTDCEKPPSIVQ